MKLMELSSSWNAERGKNLGNFFRAIGRERYVPAFAPLEIDAGPRRKGEVNLRRTAHPAFPDREPLDFVNPNRLPEEEAEETAEKYPILVDPNAKGHDLKEYRDGEGR